MTHWREIEPNIVSALDAAEQGADYDQIARAYDLLVGNGLYNRLVWGCPVAAYALAATALVARVPTGPILDFGCGSLVFTAPAYAGHEARLTLLDRSLMMLRRGKKRLPLGRFVQADALHPPTFDTVFSGGMAWGMLHLFGSKSTYLDELSGLLAPGALVAISCLVLAGRPVGDHVLAMLHKRGEAAKPETAADVELAFAARFRNVEAKLNGNMLFLTGTKDAA